MEPTCGTSACTSQEIWLVAVLSWASASLLSPGGSPLHHEISRCSTACFGGTLMYLDVNTEPCASWSRAIAGLVSPFYHPNLVRCAHICIRMHVALGCNERFSLDIAWSMVDLPPEPAIWKPPAKNSQGSASHAIARKLAGVMKEPTGPQMTSCFYPKQAHAAQPIDGFC